MTKLDGCARGSAIAAANFCRLRLRRAPRAATSQTPPTIAEEGGEEEGGAAFQNLPKIAAIRFCEVVNAQAM